jgi:hypothetical protein
MWRTRAVLSLLHEEIAGLPRDEAETPDERAETMARARRRALIVIALDWLAILVLVLLGERAPTPLTLGPSEHTVFTLAILAVAAHSGFRLGQVEKLAAVARAARRLAARDPDG